MDALFGVARKLVGPWVQEQVSKGAIEQLAEASKKSAVKKENAYEAFVTDSKKGIILTWVENQINTKLPGFLDTVLDKYRGQLYKVLTQSGENQVCAFLESQIENAYKEPNSIDREPPGSPDNSSSMIH